MRGGGYNPSAMSIAYALRSHSNSSPVRYTTNKRILCIHIIRGGDITVSAIAFKNGLGDKYIDAESGLTKIRIIDDYTYELTFASYGSDWHTYVVTED